MGQAHGGRGRPKGTRGSGRALTDGDIDRALRAARSRQRLSARAELLLCVSLGMALTAGEMAALTWHDVYDELGSVRLMVLVRARGASLGRWVQVASPVLREVLSTYAERHAPWQLHSKTTPMFKSQKGGALSPASITRLLSQLYREAGVKGGTLGSARRTIDARRQARAVDLMGGPRGAGR